MAVFLIWSASPSFAQTTLRFDRITTAQGLSNNAARQIIQDSRGFIWIGTEDGLNRYDGYGFQVYRPDPDNPRSLTRPEVEDLFEDSIGRIWIGGAGWVDRYDPNDDTITRFLDHGQGQGWAEILETPTGEIWIGGLRRGVYRLDADTDSLELVHESERSTWGGEIEIDAVGAVWVSRRRAGIESETSGELFAVVERFDAGSGKFEVVFDGEEEGRSGYPYIDAQGPDGNVWYWADPELRRFDPRSGTTTAFLGGDGDAGAPTATPTQVQGLHVDASGHVWLGTFRGGLFRFDPENEELRHWSADPEDPGRLARNQIWGPVLEDNSGQIWVRTNAGLHQLSPDTGAITRHFHDPANSTSMASSRVNDLLVDREGSIWFATEGGISRLATGELVSRHIQIGPDRSNPPMVRSVAQVSDGTIWVGAGRSLYRLDQDRGSVEPAPFAGPAPGLGYDRILEGNDGVLWLSAIPFSQSGLSRYDPTDGSFRNVRNTVSTGRPDMTISGVVDRSGTPWVAGIEQLLRFNQQTGEFDRFPLPRGGTVVGNNALAVDTRNGIWLGTIAGLLHLPNGEQSFATVSLSLTPSRAHYPVYVWEFGDQQVWTAWTGPGGLGRLDITTGRDTVYTNVVGDPASLSSNQVRHLFKDRDGHIWIGTESGLNRFEAETETFTRFTAQRNGLPSNNARAVGQDSMGRIWVKTTAGITLLDPVREVTQDVRTASGEALVTSGSGDRGIAVPLRDGTLAVGVEGGLVLVNSVPLQDPVPPAVAFTGLRTYGRDGDAPTADLRPKNGDQIELEYNSRDFSVDYVALHFGRPEGNRYRTKLEPYQTEWREAGAERSQTFTNLTPGSYTFRVNAASANDVWTEDGISLGIVVLAPWWMTWWAYALYAALILAALFVADRFRQERIANRLSKESALERARTLEELGRLKSKFFSDVSHEFRTPLTLTIGPIEDVLDRLGPSLPDDAHEDLNLAARSARRLQRLTDQILDVAKVEAGQIHLDRSAGDLGPYLREVARSFEPLARQRGIRFEVKIPDSKIFVAFDSAELDKVFLNLLSNAFKYTPDNGTIRLSASPAETDVRIDVLNTGQGIPPDELPHIFERFYQTEGRKASRPGTGIGLALVKHLVELHEGTISAESDPWVSTTFSVTLPLCPASGVSAETPSSSAAETLVADMMLAHAVGSAGMEELDDSAQDERATVLVVDDDPDMRSFVIKRLGSRYRQLEAGDGEEALEVARRELPDIVLSDVMMPKMNGYELCRAIKKNPDTEYLPVILITAKTKKEAVLEGLEQGADSYMTKPFDAQELNLRIENILRRARTLKRQFEPRRLELHATDVTVPAASTVFLENLRDTVEQHLGEEGFGVGELAAALGQSRSTLHRRIKELLDTTPVRLIRDLRLERAEQLIEQRVGSISEIAYSVGYQSVSHFSRSFRERTGLTPSQWMLRETQGQEAD